ncbi:GNAT family N-acetyltransferase, partial [Sphingobium herbicidovorans]
RFFIIALQFSMDAATEFQVRPVQPEDLETICRHRHEMFKVSGRTDEAVTPMTDNFRPWLEPRLADGRYFGWLILADAEVIAGVGMMVLDWPPHPSHPDQGARGYVLNMYVEPTYRRRGLGKRLMDLCRLEAERRGLTYTVLHATQQGRGLYEQLGWRPTTEMSLTLDAQDGAN